MEADVQVQEDGETGHGHDHLVEIMVDGKERTIAQGKYVVADLKAKLCIPAEYELDLVVGGQFKPLSDSAHIEVHKNEVFVSHVRHGGSS